MVLARNTEMLRRTQAGLQTARDTAVVPTIRLREKIRLNDAREPLEFDENAGTYDGWYTHAQGGVTVSGNAEGPASFEDTPYWMLHGISGELVEGVSDAHATLPAFERDMIPNPDEDDLAASTMELDAPDNVYVSEMVMVPEWTLRADVDGDATWMFTAPLIARNKLPQPAGYTAGVPVHEREFIKAKGTRLWIADDAADLGDPSAAVLAKFISFSLTWSNAAAPKRYMEDEDEVSAKVDRGVRQVTGQVRLEFEDDDEKANYRNGTPRAIRIERLGTVIHGAQVGPPLLTETRKRARIDIPRAYWLTPSDDPRSQNMTLTYGFRAYVDVAAGYPAKLNFVNAIADYGVELA